MSIRETILEEFEDIDLGDARLNERAKTMAAVLAEKAGNSLPEVFEDESDLEAGYRFLKNERVSTEELLAPHCSQTVQRARNSEQEILAIHDSTEIIFGGDIKREGTGF